MAVIEALRIGTGVTSNSTAKLSSLHKVSYSKLLHQHGVEAAQTYAALNEYGIQVVAENVKKYNVDCDFEWKDNVTWTRSSEYVETIERECSAAQRAGLKAELTKEVKGLPFKPLVAVRVKDQAQFNPYKYCLGKFAAFLVSLMTCRSGKAN